MSQESELNFDDILLMIPTVESFDTVDPASAENIDQLDPTAPDHIDQLDPTAPDHIDQLDPTAPDHIDQLDPTAPDHIDQLILETEEKPSGLELITFLFLTSTFPKIVFSFFCIKGIVGVF